MGDGAAPREELPLLALRGVVIFPYMVSPLEVGRARSVSAVDEAALGDRRLVLVAQRNPQAVDPSPSEVHEVGVVAEVKQILRMPEGKTRVLVEGLHRVRIEAFVQTDPHFRVTVRRLAEPVDEDPDPARSALRREALVRGVLAALDDYSRLSGQLSQEFISAAASLASTLNDPGRLADLVAGQMPLPADEKQMLLEAASQLDRLERLLALLHRELEVLEVQRRIQVRVRRQVEKTQKEFFLREQMRAIQKELGERDERQTEIEEFRRRIEQSGMPREAREKAEHELSRLEKMPPVAAEAVVVRTYLDWMVSLPWNHKTPDRLDVQAAEGVLNEDHYGLAQVKERVLEFLAVRQLTRARVRGPILCLVGPPGVGKTSLARSVARALERRFIRISLGGVRDEAEIRGHRRTYVGAMPGKILQAVRRAGSRNPVMLLDEVDKMSYDFRGDPASALLEVLDPEQNHAFSDHYLEVPFDLSDVLFITTANVLQAVPRALRDRMEVITIPGYTEFEKLQIARRHLLPRQLKDHGLSPRHLTVADGALCAIVRRYTREAGVRELERHLAAVCRKTARAAVRNPSVRFRVTSANLHRFLGPPRYHENPTEAEDRVGLALGLAYTEAGGDLMAIEVAVVPGRGRLWLTGKLGEVMRESAQASYSYIRSRASQLAIDPGFYERVDIHVHVPEGAIPKDGPSAGITMAAALASALTGRPVRRDVAMTGEITLRGRVLPVGGIKEKVLAAHRYGIGRLIIPRANHRDLEEVPSAVRRQLQVDTVEHMDQVLELALLPPQRAARAQEAHGEISGDGLARLGPSRPEKADGEVGPLAPPGLPDPCGPQEEIGGDVTWPFPA